VIHAGLVKPWFPRVSAGAGGFCGHLRKTLTWPVESSIYKSFSAANFTTKPSMNQTIEVTQRLASYV
jgi:hypothetical protein